MRTTRGGRVDPNFVASTCTSSSSHFGAVVWSSCRLLLLAAFARRSSLGVWRRFVRPVRRPARAALSLRGPAPAGRARTTSGRADARRARRARSAGAGPPPRTPSWQSDPEARSPTSLHCRLMRRGSASAAPSFLPTCNALRCMLRLLARTHARTRTHGRPTNERCDACGLQARLAGSLHEEEYGGAHGHANTPPHSTAASHRGVKPPAPSTTGLALGGSDPPPPSTGHSRKG